MRRKLDQASRFAVVVPAIPILITLISLAGTRWYPVSDLAQAEVRMQAFWTHPPLIGAAGRIGPLIRQGAHPGPAAWWFAQPVYALFGRNAYAFLVATGTLSALWMGVAVGLARRLGGNGVAWTVVGVQLAFMRVWGAETFVYPWNPWLGVTAFMAFVALVWHAMRGGRYGLAGVALLGSYCLQAHAGYLVIVTTFGMLAMAGSVRIRWAYERAALRRDLLAGLAVSALMWLPPVLEQVTSPYGNLRILYDHFAHPPEAPIGLASGIRVTAGAFNVRGDWLVVDPALPLDRQVWCGGISFLAVWASAVVLAWRHRLAEPLRLHLIAGVGAVVAVISASRIFGTVFSYLVPWVTVLAGCAVVAIVWSVAGAWKSNSALGGDRSRPKKLAAMCAAGCLVALVVVDSARFVEADLTKDRVSLEMAELAPQVERHLDHDRRYLVKWSDAVSLGAYGFGMVLELNRSGYRSFALPVFRTTLLAHNVAQPQEVDEAIAIVTGPQIEQWRRLPGAVEIASVDRRTAAQRAEVDTLTASVVERISQFDAQLAETVRTNYWAGIIDPRMPSDVLRDLERLRDLGLQTSVFLLGRDLEPAVS